MHHRHEAMVSGTDSAAVECETAIAMGRKGKGGDTACLR